MYTFVMYILYCYCLEDDTGSILSQRCENNPTHLPLAIAIDCLTKVSPYLACVQQISCDLLAVLSCLALAVT